MPRWRTSKTIRQVSIS